MIAKISHAACRSFIDWLDTKLIAKIDNCKDLLPGSFVKVECDYLKNFPIICWIESEQHWLELDFLLLIAYDKINYYFLRRCSIITISNYELNHLETIDAEGYYKSVKIRVV